VSVTAAQNSYNLRTARNTVAASLGVDPANMDYAERITYNRALAGFIVAHPAGFTDDTLSTAAGIVGRSYSELADTSFQWGEFGAETLANAPAVLGGFSNKLFLVLAVAAVAYAVTKAGHSPSPASA
jgi:hypothetical protein